MRGTLPSAGTADRATLVATGVALVALPALALAAGVVETLLAPRAVFALAAVTLTLGSTALALGRDPVALADARVWLTTALLVDLELLTRAVDGLDIAGLGAVYAHGADALQGSVAGRRVAAAATGLDAGFVPFCLVLAVALVAVHDAAADRRSAAGDPARRRRRWDDGDR